MLSRSIPLLAALMLGGASFTAAPASAQELSQFLTERGYYAIPLNKLSTGHETVQLVINGVEGLFVLDSGAGGTVLHTGSLAKFSLAMPENGGEVSSGAGGQVTWFPLPIDSLALGGRSLDVDQIRTLDLTPVVSRLEEAAGVEVDGVVGQDILTRFKGVLDVGAQTLFLQAEPWTQ